ncbi:MAG: PDZ domain-containing protein [Phycisphaerae bacterium]|nr:PDZ domain-containing protein [Phycisphaerae bacterium]
MKHVCWLRCGIPGILAIAAATARAAPPAPDELGLTIARISDRFGRALVVVKFGLESEDGKRAEVNYVGVVVAPTGATLVPISAGLLEYPRAYFKRFELLLRGRKDEPIPARLVGVNNLVNVAFVEPTKPRNAMAFVDFADAGELPRYGRNIVTLGLLGERDGFRSSFQTARMGPQVGDDEFVIAGVPAGGTGALVFSAEGKLIGVAGSSSAFDARAFRGDDDDASGFLAQARVRRAATFAPAVRFALEHRRDRPEPWMGVAGLNVASRDVIQAYGLSAGTTAIIVGAVAPGQPAERAGVRPKDFIVGMNDEPIAAGATDDETLETWTRRVKRMNVGDTIRLAVWRDGQTLAIPLTLSEAPTPAEKADRAFNSVLGMAVRDLVFRDRFDRKLDADEKGVVVAHLVQSGPAETAELYEDDIIQKIDDQLTPDLKTYRRVIEERLARSPTQLVVSVLRGTSERLVLRIELPVTTTRRAD